MRKLGWVIGTILAAALSGCGSSLSDSTAPGPVDKGLYRDAVLDNEQRLAGEDRRVVPLYKTPLEAIGVGLDYLFVRPFANFFIYISHDNAAYAARKMANTKSPDLRREGMLRLVDFQFARRGIYLKGYAYLARDTEDYTVRAAAIRALNRCRRRDIPRCFCRRSTTINRWSAWRRPMPWGIFQIRRRSRPWSFISATSSRAWTCASPAPKRCGITTPPR